MNNIYVCDKNRYKIPKLLDMPIDFDRQFFMLDGEEREIREIHQTKNGTQIELFDHNPYDTQFFSLRK